MNISASKIEDQSNAGQPSKRQRTITIVNADNTSGSTNPPAPPQNEGVLAAVNKLTKLVEGHPDFYSKLERMLEDLHNKLEPEISAAIRKEKNEDSCPIYKVSNDVLKHILGYVGEKQYRFVACVSYWFHKVYLDTFRNETLTSIVSAVASVSCARLCLATANQDRNTRSKQLFKTAASYGKLDVLQWGHNLGYDIDKMFNKYTIADAALNGHLEVVKYLRKLGIEWDQKSCSNAAVNVHLKLLK
jgi:hypothetical protein